MADRTRLHELVDTLPDDALNVARGTLEHLQTWPPQEPPQTRAMREAQREKMRNAIRPGSGGGGGGGGSYHLGPGGRIEYGHQGFSYWDGDTVVIETHRFHAGYELCTRGTLALGRWRHETGYAHSSAGPSENTPKAARSRSMKKE